MRGKLKSIGIVGPTSMRTYIVAAALVLLSALGVTYWTWNNAKRNLQEDVQSSLDSGLTSAQGLITNTVGNYSAVLNGGVGLLKASSNVDRQAWAQYVANLNFNSYPGLSVMSYSDYVPASEIAAYTASRQADISPVYAIVPDGSRDIYVPARFIEPATSQTQELVGFDSFSEPNRRKAMEQARDTGMPSITKRLVLISDKRNKRDIPGFIIYLPVYATNAPVATVGERQAAITGFVSTGVRSNELIEGLFGKTLTKDSALQVYDGNKLTPENLIYQSSTFDGIKDQDGLTVRTLSFNLGNNTWTMKAFVNSNIASEAQRNQPNLILASGIALSFLVSGILLIIMVTRARAISQEKNQEVQEAKDSLISLASHQLRTPATGVKQFIGMVLEGYAGEITKEQRTMLKKAYQSNERQLEIINQILHVTRADSGRLVIHKVKTDMGKLINTVIDEHAQSLKLRGQKIIFKPAKPVFLKADRQYMSMAIDNLLSNASKYSHANTTIRLTIRDVKDSVVLTVSDKGVGIAEDDLHRLFQKFSRIDNELSVEAGGNGIGLYLCQEIVRMHNGTIEVHSTAGRGTTFTITLPKH